MAVSGSSGVGISASRCLRESGGHTPATACSGDGAGVRRRVGRQAAVARAARRTVAPPDAVRVVRAPRAATIGPPIAVPRGEAMIRAALRAARTVGRLAVVVID